MTSPRHPDELLRSLTDDEIAQLDAACDRFEAGWRTVPPPNVTTFLASAADTIKELLLFELLAIEGDFRETDPAFCEEACAQRFPEHAQTVRGWFAAGYLAAGASRDGAGTDQSSIADGSTIPLPPGPLPPGPLPPGAPPSPDQAGNERFRAVRWHASGGLGEIWVADDVELGREVALKQIKPQFADDPGYQARFLREAEITGRLEHPGIAPVYGLGKDRHGRPFYAMRFVSGETFQAAIDRWHAEGAPLGVEFRKLLARFLDVCHVVEFSHRRGVIHRDLKPKNVMLGEFGETVVLDWGLGRKLGEAGSNLPADQAGATFADDGRTQYGSAMGTPNYMSPEQAKGHLDKLAPATDVFSLGAFLYCILTGRSPYSNEEGSDAVEQACQGKFEPPRKINRRVPAALESICLKAMALEPAGRYTSARVLADDVDRWLADEPVTAHSDTWPTRLFRWSRRHKTLVTTSAVGSLLLLASLAAIVVLQQRAQERIVDRNRIIEQQRDDSYTSIQRDQIARASRTADKYEARVALNKVHALRRGWEWRRLAFELELGPKPISSVESHDWGVLDLLWNEKTGILITTGHDGRLLVRRNDSGGPHELLKGSWSNERLAWQHALLHARRQQDDRQQPIDLCTEDCFTRLAWLQPGIEFVGVSLHGHVSAWSIPEGNEQPVRRELAVHDRALFAVAARDGRVLCGGADGSLLLVPAVAAGDPAKVCKPLASEAPVLEVIALPQRRWAVAQQDGVVTVLDETATNVLASLSAAGPAWGLDVSPDGSLLAVACGSGQIECYRIDKSSSVLDRQESFRLPDDLEAPVGVAYLVKFSPDGQWLASGDNLGRLLVWDRRTGKAAFVGHTDRVVSEDAAETLPWPFRRRLAAIAFSTTGDHCLIAGHDPVVRRWQVRGEQGISEWQLGPAARARFDPIQPNLLWAVTADGLVSIWDSRTRRRLTSARAHEGAVIAIDVVAAKFDPGEQDPPASSLAVTCGQDGHIRLWNLRGEQLTPLYNVIKHNISIKDVALSPNGRRLAASDTAQQLTVWDCATAKRLATRQLGVTDERFAIGRLALNSDGSRLAAFGAGATLYVLDAADLSIVEKPNVVAGNGGTALLWHPSDPETLFAGDTLGRIVRYPRRDWGRFAMLSPKSEVAGIGWSPYGEGGRLAVAWRNGIVRIIDPKWAGELLVLQSPHTAAGRSAPNDLQFDARGDRLALVHDDGTIEIWETPADPRPAPVQLARQWRRTPLVNGPRLGHLELRRQAIALDDDGRLILLLSALDEKQDITAPEAEGRNVYLAREGGLPTTLEQIPGKAVARSLALHRDGRELLATVRRPLPQAGGVMGAFLLLRGQLLRGAKQTTWSEEDLTTRPNNEGFDVEFLPQFGAVPAIVHYSHSGSYLLATCFDGTRWQTTRLGRQGDGFGHLTVASSDGRKWYSIFSPDGLNGKLRTLTCLVTEWERPANPAVVRGWLPSFREVCDPAYGLYRRSLAFDANHALVLLYAHAREHPNHGLLLARRINGEWMSSTVLDFNPPFVSNLSVDRSQALAFAYVGPDERTVYLAYGAHDHWTSEIVGELPDPQGEERRDDLLSNLYLVRDSNDRPIIVVVFAGSQPGSVWSFRLME